MTLTEGARVLSGRYELGDLVGSGGMAEVYRATDPVLGRVVAVKLLRTGAAPDGDQRARLVGEARTLAALDHPGLVTLLDAGLLEPVPYLVMQYVDGPSLAQIIRTGGALDPARVAVLGRQVAEALGYAHRQGVVHRDVKPGNILVAADDRALLADFGIARLVGDAAGQTKSGETVGSPAYLSPEQVSGAPLTEAVDVYSLGLVLLEALTGTRAYPGTPVESAVARLAAAPAIPTSLNAGWRDLLLQMTRTDPRERPTALEVVATLEAAVDPNPVAVPVTDLDAETGAFDLSELSGAIEQHAADRTRVGVPAPVPAGRWSGLLWLVSAALLVGLLVVIVLFGGVRSDPDAGQPTGEVPSEVPERMREPLQNLHDAVREAR